MLKVMIIRRSGHLVCTGRLEIDATCKILLGILEVAREVGIDFKKITHRIGNVHVGSAGCHSVREHCTQSQTCMSSKLPR